MVIKRIIFIWGARWATHKTSSNIFLENKRTLCHFR
jgi:hypothetical protein